MASPLALLTDKSELNYLWNSIRPSEVLQRSELDHYRGGLVLVHAPSELLMKQLVEFIDAGNSVFWCIPSKSLRAQIQKAHQWIHTNSDYSLQYLADILKLSIYLKDLSSEIQGQDLIGTAGLIFGNEARRILLNQQWTDFDELEKIPGAWSLDQSLVHSLMRRQMSIKHALSLSVNPQRLDEQLKEMGI